MATLGANLRSKCILVRPIISTSSTWWTITFIQAWQRIADSYSMASDKREARVATGMGTEVTAIHHILRLVSFQAWNRSSCSYTKSVILTTYKTNDNQWFSCQCHHPEILITPSYTAMPPYTAIFSYTAIPWASYTCSWWCRNTHCEPANKWQRWIVTHGCPGALSGCYMLMEWSGWQLRVYLRGKNGWIG